MRGLHPDEYTMARRIANGCGRHVADEHEERMIERLISERRATLGPKIRIGLVCARRVTLTAAGREAMRLHEAVLVGGAV